MKISISNIIAAVAVAATTLGFSGGASAVELPCGTARLIVPWGAGGGTDVIFRQFTEAANKAGAKPQLQVVNISGQGGNKGAKEAVKAKPNGCTLFAMHQSALTSYLTARVDFTWDAFEPVALLTRTPAIVGANPDVVYNDMKDLVAEAKKRPGEVLAGGTLGSTSQFVFLLIEDLTGTKLKHISYDGTRQRMTALLAKNIEIGEINLASAKKYIQTNELKALGITTENRNPEIPNVPTLKEQGINLIYGTDRGIVLPKGTSAEVIAYWGDIAKKAAADKDFAAAMEAKGTQVLYQGPADYRAYLENTMTNWTRIAKKVGVYKRKD